MADDPTNYAPKYVDIDDVPISGPGTGTSSEYSHERKQFALYHAETSLELDVNDGSEITASDLTNAHRTAVMNLATHVLTHAAEDPSDVTLGDMQSGGGNATEYSSRFLEAYEDLVDRINTSGLSTGGSGNWSIAMNTASDLDDYSND